MNTNVVHSEVRSIGGADVHIEGQGPVLIMLHGWPDSHRLWDGVVPALSDAYRCVRFDLPGYDLSRPPKATSVKDITALIAQVAEELSPGEKVSLLVHDWGCFYGYEFAAKHSDKVARVVGVDIGDASSKAFLASLSLTQKMGLVGYQLWLAIAWKLGGLLPGLANAMTRGTARWARWYGKPEQLGWQMNYPYAVVWFGVAGGVKGMTRAEKVLGHKMPMLYLYGQRKPFLFHSPEWIESLQKLPGCGAKGFATGHWIMMQARDEFNATVRQWLDHGTVA
ncbi:alpha/beta fold hydrolase [Hydrogenophaga sp. 5NK40-0174]|uniref:alpha/beta fold hydrolase n=1 Tax=Hydrogenophaga sp. 5NK40-0174 TaxID=3127649 RepID=UPI00333F7F85